MRERVDLGVLLLVNSAQASERIDTVNVHGTASANALSATSSERKRAVHLVLDLDEGVQHHWAASIEVDLVCLQVWLLCWLIGVLQMKRLSASFLTSRSGVAAHPSVNLEVLVVLRLGGC